MRAILGKKLGMTRIFDKQGREIPITLVEAKTNTVTRVTAGERENRIQIAAGQKKRLNKSEKGQFESLKLRPEKIFEVETIANHQVGTQIKVDLFAEGEKINVSGVSKGKGFAGTVKRHGFTLGPKTHGSNNYRQPGSIGSMFPQRVIKGRRMAGHLGNQKKTIKKLEIIKIDPEKSLIFIKGAVPGAKNSWVKLWSQNEA